MFSSNFYILTSYFFFLSQFAYALYFGSMFMLPEFHKIQQENNEPRATLKDKEAINQVTKNDLLKLNRRVMELGLQVNIANQKVEHEANKFRSLQSKKEKVDLKLNEAAAEVQTIKELTLKAEEEAGRNRAGDQDPETKSHAARIWFNLEPEYN